jgi:hypothetical protein
LIIWSWLAAVGAELEVAVVVELAVLELERDCL